MARSFFGPQAAPALIQDEAYRVLRSNLLVAVADLERPCVVITSAAAGEGKTTVCANLARSLALAGYRLVLVDLDLRHPGAHHLVGAHNEVGVADLLLERRTLSECLQFVDVEASRRSTSRGFYFLGTGGLVANPSELLSSTRTAKLLQSLADQADIVLLDTPPVLPVADTLVIGRMAAGAILVVESRRSPINAVLDAKDALTRNQTRLLGVVLNRFQERDNPYGVGYGYGYGEQLPENAPPE